MKKINKKIELILCVLLGYLGAHKFYEGKFGIGVLYLCTMGLFGIGWIYDIVVLVANYNNPNLPSTEDNEEEFGTIEIDIEKIVAENPRDRKEAIKQYRKRTGCKLKKATVEIDRAYERMGINPYKRVCPKCKSENYTIFLEEKEIIPEKRVVQYSTNLNPLKPFTFANSTEKVVNRGITKTYSKFVCNDCGTIFK